MAKRPRQAKEAPKRRPEPFHAPFRALRARLPRPDKASAPVPFRPAPPPEPTEEDLFREAMVDVRPLPSGHRQEPPRRPPPRPPDRSDEDAETLACLADLCAGVGPFEIADTSEYIEGSAPGVDRRLVRRLRRGEFSVQGHLDLHGLTQEMARRAVEGFVTAARGRGFRCVLLIHGRGRNSKDQIPVLKQRVATWLRRGKLGHSVLAFASARPYDGGAGALYVLLRR